MTVRVRIGPSPTGEPHIGTAYTALVNEAFAVRHGGQFVVRIEDTDQSRSTPESEAKILEALHWLGFTWDEGPDVGGPYGPYRQSERTAIYQTYVQQLLDSGHAFKCFCTPETLDIMRLNQRREGKIARYDGRCMLLSQQEVEDRVGAGEPFVVRMKIPTQGEAVFNDGIYGKVAIPWANVDMQVLQKSDGMPTYHLANVVDDHLMKITHVIRGEEWVSSTPKHVALYEYFGWEAPQFVHLPVLRNLDKSKLSKRKNPTSISWFIHQGYLREAMINFLGLFFCSIPEGEEMMDRQAFHEAFAFEHASKAGAVFDLAKLDWLNGRWLREGLSEAAYLGRVTQWAAEADVLRKGLLLSKTRITRLSDLPGLAGFLLSGAPALSKADFAECKAGEEKVSEMLYRLHAGVDTLPDWTEDALQALCGTVAEEVGLKMRLAMQPVFIAITGSAKSLPAIASMAVLGRSVTRDRLRKARDLFDWKPFEKLDKAAAKKTGAVSSTEDDQAQG